VPFAWIAFRAESPEVYGAALFAGELLAFLSTGPVNVVIVNSVPVGIRATAVAVSIFTIHLLGDATSPAIIGASPMPRVLRRPCCSCRCRRGVGHCLDGDRVVTSRK
jgi:hypothetical protein